MNQKSLYERLGSYDGITAFTNDLLPRLQNDPQLARFWQNRGEDGIKREHQLLIDYLCASAGGLSNSVEKWPGNQGKQRRKLSTLICVMIRYFAGETLGVIYGFYCRNQKASFCKW